MTDRQSITAIGSEAPFIPQEYFYPRIATRCRLEGKELDIIVDAYTARRQRAIDEAVRKTFTPNIIAWWKEGGIPAFAVTQMFEEIQQEYRKIMAAR